MSSELVDLTVWERSFVDESKTDTAMSNRFDAHTVAQDLASSSPMTKILPMSVYHEYNL